MIFPPTCHPSGRYRYVILILSLLCLTSVCSNQRAYNFTVICMSPPAGNSSSSSFIPRSDVPVYNFNQSEKTFLMWAVAVGSILATFPFNVLFTKFGARYVFFGAGIVSAVTTLILPATASWGFGYFLAARFVQGITFAADFAAIGIVVAHWASLKQQAVFMGLLTSFTPLSEIATNPISGVLCDSQFGWPAVFYLHGAVGLILFLLWVLLFRDDPSTHPFVTSLELSKMHHGKSDAHIQMDSFVPYWAILKDPFVWIIWLNALADLSAGLFVNLYAPTYFSSVLGFSVQKTGMLAAIPGAVHIPVKLSLAVLSDYLLWPSETCKLRIFNSAALGIPAVLYAGLGFLPQGNSSLGVIFVILIIAALGANCGGFYKAGTLVSRQYSAFVISNIQFLKCVALFVCPGLVALLVDDDTDQTQWRLVFVAFTVILVTANVVFCIYSTSDPRPFTFITRTTLSNTVSSSFHEKKKRET